MQTYCSQGPTEIFTPAATVYAWQNPVAGTHTVRLTGMREITMSVGSTFEGACTCGAIRYRLISAPMIVHCCHCSWCQRETGSAFVINAMIETDRLELLQGEPIMVDTPSCSGKGQQIARCARVGTLQESCGLPPDVHIYTTTKQPWVLLPPHVPAVDEFYDLDQVWSPASQERRATLRAAKARNN